MIWIDALFDPAVLEIVGRSVYVSGIATVLATLWSIPLAILISFKKFRGKLLVKGLFNAGIGIPTVALGLILYLLLSRSGPLGIFELLFSPRAIIIGQSILITPIMVSFIISSLESIDPGIRELARTLGASEREESIAVIREASPGVLLAIMASFNRAIAELGVALMVGGNIRGLTRVLTTAIALETVRGEIMLAVSLMLILLLIVFILSLAINLLQRKA
jgi:tungstate transport system permease protein